MDGEVDADAVAVEFDDWCEQNMRPWVEDHRRMDDSPSRQAGVPHVTLLRNRAKIQADDPWGYGNSLEWATSSPPPRHNSTPYPRIRSERPAFELHRR